MDNIVSEIRIQGSGAVSNSLTKAQQSFSIGSSPFPALDVSFTYGRGDNQVDLWWWAKDIDPVTGLFSNLITLPPGQTDVWDLDNLDDYEGNPVAFDYLKLLVLAVVAPDGKKSLRFGPQGVSGAHQLCFDSTSSWMEVFYHLILPRPVRGWDIKSAFGTESGKKVCVSNPTGEGTGDDTIQYTLLILGTKVGG